MEEDQKDQSKEEIPATDENGSLCECVQDPFATLPPELRPKAIPKKSSLRQVTCPGCGLKYTTNRSTDLCIECERKGVQPIDQSLEGEYA